MTREEAKDYLAIIYECSRTGKREYHDKYQDAFDLAIEALSQPELVRCCKCAFWDRDTLRHQFNDFRDWNEAECKVLAERDGYNEINRYVEADDYCSRAERKE